MWELELPPPVGYFMVSFFLLLCVAYGFWAAHVFLGVPFWRSLREEFTAIFAVGSAVILGGFFVKGIRLTDWFEEKMEGTAKCPHCKGTVLKLEMVCRHCSKPV
jgi:hypothetical protein